MGSVGESSTFRPLRPASKGRLFAAAIIGSLMWVVAMVVGALLLDRSAAIQIGVIVTFASFLVSLCLLVMLRAARRRRERRYAAR
jgi:hypothetical protein